MLAESLARGVSTFNAWAELSLALPQFFDIATENLVLVQIRNCYGFVTCSNFGSQSLPQRGREQRRTLLGARSREQWLLRREPT